ncbi:PadR family transcriptional regulator [Nesterenkonia sandarakina]|uniref:PadR family transcriptional regulator n=2 Tax=Nesterenkonia sandarakina TaxID=272918 RepID=A0A2T0YIU4_9MICC|nr:PadR family transcriptional regulator [Nesterenkonia sandarakina]
MKRSKKYLRVAVELITSQEKEHWVADLRSELRMRSGALYPILWDMLNAGYLEDGWVETPPRAPKGRFRRYYVLTDQGKSELGAAVRAHRTQARLAPSPRFRPATA